MNKDLIRAYFRAYRARITDLEAENQELREQAEAFSYQLYDLEASASRAKETARREMANIRQEIDNATYDNYRLTDRVNALERNARRSW